MARRQTTEEWILQCLQDKDQHDGKPLTKLALVHYVGGEPNEVDKVSLGGNLSARDLAKRLDERGKNHVYDMPGLQTLAIYAFYGDDPDVGSTRQFTLNGKTVYEGGVTEPPTTAGLTTQAMRHHEAMAQMYIQGQQATVNSLVRANERSEEALERANAEIDRLRRENGDAWVMVRDAALQQNRELIEQQRILVKEERNAALWNKVVQWAPAIINRLTGKEIMPQATEDTAIVEGILSELEPAHVQMMMAMVSQKPGGAQVGGLLAARANALFAKRAAEEKARTEARQLSAGLDPESEVA